MGIFGLFGKKNKETLDKGLEKTKTSVFDKLARAVAGKSKVDDDVLDNLEEVLITSDVGVDTTLKIIERIEERVARDKYVSTAELNGILRCRGPADALAYGDLHTCRVSLERPEDKFVPLEEIESCPVDVFEGGENEGGDICKICHKVRNALNERFGLPDQQFIICIFHRTLPSHQH